MSEPVLQQARPRWRRPGFCRAASGRAIRLAAAAALAAGLSLWSLPAAGAAGTATGPVLSVPFFASPPLSPAVVGMGGAAAAWVDDASALYYNPAGLAERRFEAGFTTAVQEGDGLGDPSAQLEAFRRLLADPASAGDVDQELAAMGGLVMNGSGLGVMAQGSAHVAGGEGSGWFVSAVGFGSGYRLQTKILGAQLFAGTTVRLLYAESFHVSPSGSPTASSVVGRGFTSDLGMMARWGDALSLGVVLHDVAGTMAWYEREGAAPATTVQWILPLAGVRAGLSVTLPGERGRMAVEWSGDGSWAVGVEQRLFFNAVAVRAGHAAQGDRSVNTAGLGLRLGPFGLDASVVVPADPGPATLVAGLNLRF